MSEMNGVKLNFYSKKVFCNNILLSSIYNFLSFPQKKAFSTLNRKSNSIFNLIVKEIDIENIKEKKIKNIKKKFCNWSTLKIKGKTLIEKLIKLSKNLNCSNFKQLSISTDDAIKDYSFIERFNELEYLCLENTQIENISFLTKIKKLKTLVLKNNIYIKFYDLLAELKNVDKLVLYINNAEVNSLKFLDEINNLEEFSFINNRVNKNVDSIISLGNSTKLRKLFLEVKFNRDDIFFLSNLNDLEELYLNLNISQLIDTRNLPKLKKLKSFELKNTNINDISFIEESFDLERIEISNIDTIRDYKPLSNLENLKNININDEFIFNNYRHYFRPKNSENKYLAIFDFPLISKLITLDLPNEFQIKYLPLEKIPRLEEMIIGTKIDETVNFSLLKNLKEITLNFLDQKGYIILLNENFCNLKIINLNFNDFSKYLGLINIKALEKLTFENKFFCRNNINFVDNNLDMTMCELNDLNFFYLYNLSNITKVNFEYNNIQDINGLENLHNLKEINLTGNKIEDISIFANNNNFNKLEVLILRKNNITNFEPLISLKNLKKLDISFMNIKDISFIKKIDLKNFSYLNLRGNIIKNNEIIENLEKLNKSKENKIFFFDERLINSIIDENTIGTYNINHIRIIFLGDTYSGKTCFINRYKGHRFVMTFKTIGIDLTSKKCQINDKFYDFTLIELGGGEKYKSFSLNYINNGVCFLILFDLTLQNSLNEAIFFVEYIQNDTRVENKKIIYLVGNKLDLSVDRIISTEEGEKIAAKYGVKYFEVSAKAGIGINEVMKYLYEDIYLYDKDFEDFIPKYKQKKRKKEKGCYLY